METVTRTILWDVAIYWIRTIKYATTKWTTKSLGLDTVDKFLHQNEKGNKTQLVCHGIDPERFKDAILEILTKFKDYQKVM